MCYLIDILKKVLKMSPNDKVLYLNQIGRRRSQRSENMKSQEVKNRLKLRPVTRVTLQFSALAELEPGKVVCPSVNIFPG